MQYVIFEMADNRFAIPMSFVREVLKSPQSTPLPQSADFMEGVFEIRGHSVPLMNMRKRLKYPDRENLMQGTVIVIKQESLILGLRVDRVLNIDDISENTLDSVEEVRGVFWDPKLLAGIARKKGHAIFILQMEALLEGIQHVEK